MTIKELIIELNKHPPHYEVRLWCDHSDTDWEIGSVEGNNEHFPKVIFIVEGDD